MFMGIAINLSMPVVCLMSHPNLVCRLSRCSETSETSPTAFGSSHADVLHCTFESHTFHSRSPYLYNRPSIYTKSNYIKRRERHYIYPFHHAPWSQLGSPIQSPINNHLELETPTHSQNQLGVRASFILGYGKERIARNYHHLWSPGPPQSSWDHPPSQWDLHGRQTHRWRRPAVQQEVTNNCRPLWKTSQNSD